MLSGFVINDPIGWWCISIALNHSEVASGAVLLPHVANPGGSDLHRSSRQMFRHRREVVPIIPDLEDRARQRRSSGRALPIGDDGRDQRVGRSRRRTHARGLRDVWQLRRKQSGAHRVTQQAGRGGCSALAAAPSLRASGGRLREQAENRSWLKTFVGSSCVSKHVLPSCLLLPGSNVLKSTVELKEIQGTSGLNLPCEAHRSLFKPAKSPYIPLSANMLYGVCLSRRKRECFVWCHDPREMADPDAESDRTILDRIWAL